MPSSAPRLDLREEKDGLVLALEGRLDCGTTGRVWREAFDRLKEVRAARLTIDASRVEYCDGAGIGLLVELRNRWKESEIRGLSPRFRSLLDLFPPGEPSTAPSRRPATSFPEEVGRATAAVFADVGRQIGFVGELLVALARAIVRPGDVRWSDAIRVASAAGVNALPIISLMGFLIGLILAFQSAAQLKMVGAEVFVSDLVAVSVVRELGPLMTAILIAGRSGSAFAAELGTMKVNEEVDALTTMGLEPVRFLVVPRVLAGVLVTPLLTLYFDLLALAGGALVVGSFGYPLITFAHHVRNALTVTMFVSGLAKTFVFGLLIAGTGCQRGLETGTGAVAVGLSTTRSVVSGILLTILVDGVFAVAYYSMGI